MHTTLDFHPRSVNTSDNNWYYSKPASFVALMFRSDCITNSLPFLHFANGWFGNRILSQSRYIVGSATYTLLFGTDMTFVWNAIWCIYEYYYHFIGRYNCSRPSKWIYIHYRCVCYCVILIVYHFRSIGKHSYLYFVKK